MEVDKEILADPVAGSERLLSEYGDRLFNTARKMCCNEADAEDLTFKTLERVVLKIGTYKGNSSFFSWMCSILVNFIRMDARRKIPNALEFCEDVPETADVCPTPVEWAEKADGASGFDSVFDILSVARHLVKVADPSSPWLDDIISVVTGATPFVLRGMGFPADWQTLTLWK